MFVGFCLPVLSPDGGSEVSPLPTFGPPLRKYKSAFSSLTSIEEVVVC